MTLFLLRKAIIRGGAAGDLFAMPVQVKEHTRKDGVVVHAHTETRMVHGGQPAHTNPHTAVQAVEKPHPADVVAPHHYRPSQVAGVPVMSYDEYKARGEKVAKMGYHGRTSREDYEESGRRKEIMTAEAWAGLSGREKYRLIQTAPRKDQMAFLREAKKEVDAAEEHAGITGLERSSVRASGYLRDQRTADHVTAYRNRDKEAKPAGTKPMALLPKTIKGKVKVAMVTIAIAGVGFKVREVTENNHVVSSKLFGSFSDARAHAAQLAEKHGGVPVKKSSR